ncbi:hypothetical protein [Sorangium sp. So ce513]|uniref:hypothetical protein n=1 Tax=Sorangium sp. So ce513 TaxID=3133315 RepID=UPI003F63F8CD
MRTTRTIRNCPIRMKVVCPKTWDALEPTGQDDVRHCAHCGEAVYFCRTDEETVAHARAGRCIAREQPHPSELPRVVLGRPAPPSPEPTPEQALALRLTARERGITTLVSGPIASASRECPGCGYPVPDFRKRCYVCSFELGRA